MTLHPTGSRLLVTLGMGTLFLIAACTGSEGSISDGGNGSGSGGSASSGTGGSGATGSGGTSATTGAGGTTATTGAGGTSATGTGGTSATGAGGAGGTTATTGAGGTTATTGAGGTTGVGGAAGTGAGGMSNPTGAGGAGGTTAQPALNCGAMGVAIENAGPVANRVNYVILGDGYDATTVNTTFMTNIASAMTKRFTAVIGQPYLRYRKFVNICALKIVSQNNGVSLGTPAAAGPTAFNCGEERPGQDTRLATCNTGAAMTAMTAALPAGFEVDWHAIMLNNSKWWNTGSSWMLWSGGNADGPGAALHEGGHGFHQFADEYCSAGTGSQCGTVNGGADAGGTDSRLVNLTNFGTTSSDKWPMWLTYTQAGATLLQGTFSLGSGPYRPSVNSMMNSLFGTNTNTAFNSVSREKMVMDIYRAVTPVDSSVPPAGAVSNPATLQVNVIDPLVIDVDWSVDGTVVAAKGGPTFDVAGRRLTAGSHTIAARAYDNAQNDLVRQKTGTAWGRMNWARSVQTVTWTVTIP